MNRAFPALLAPTLYRMMTLKFRQRRPAGRWFGGPRARSSARNRESTRRKSRKNPRCPPGASALQSASMPGATPCPTISAAARGIIAVEGEERLCVCCGEESCRIGYEEKEVLDMELAPLLCARDHAREIGVPQMPGGRVSRLQPEAPGS